MNKTKKSRLCAAVLAVFLCLTIARCVPGRKGPAFITQPGGGNRQCGAFSTAYYQWLKAGKTLSTGIQEDKAAVDAIYSEIQFGSGFAGALEPYNIPPDYSDPLKIMKYLGSGATGSAAAGIMYRRPGDPLFDSLYTLLGRMEAADFEEARKEDSALPRLDAAHSFAIVICRSKSRGLHYMLFQRLESGTLVYYDPYKGAPRAASYAMMTGEKAIDPVWVSSGCGILLP